MFHINESVTRQYYLGVRAQTMNKTVLLAHHGTLVGRHNGDHRANHPRPRMLNSDESPHLNTLDNKMFHCKAVPEPTYIVLRVLPWVSHRTQTLRRDKRYAQQRGMNQIWRSR